jgi:transporter family protein
MSELASRDRDSIRMTSETSKTGIIAAWLPFSLLSLLGWGLWGFVQKPLTDRIDVWSIAFLEGTTTLALALVWAIALREQLSPRQRAVPFVMAAAACGYTGNIAFLMAVERGTASVVVPLTAMYPLVTIAVSMAVLKESISASQKLGVVLAAGAIFFLSR